MLGAVASVYGRESDEYEMAGGVKRVRHRRIKTADATADATANTTTDATIDATVGGGAIDD
jgi:hypothetical protein